jgi:hypothetical protein
MAREGLRRGGERSRAGARRGDGAAVGEQFAEIVEDDHAVAEQAPPLFRVGRDDPGGVAVGTIRRRTRGPV